MMMKMAQVILRTRPISPSESAMKGFSRCIRQENSHSITWLGQPETRFTFDHVAGEHITQVCIYAFPEILLRIVVLIFFYTSQQ